MSIILFLNKYDLLEQKVANPETDIRWYFPQFVGNPHSILDVKSFILTMFSSARRNQDKGSKDKRNQDRSNQDKPFFYHYTTAVNTENIKVVFNYVKDTILQRNLRTLMLD